jgi:hypothetical protein
MHLVGRSPVGNGLLVRALGGAEAGDGGDWFDVCGAPWARGCNGHQNHLRSLPVSGCLHGLSVSECSPGLVRWVGV